MSRSIKWAIPGMDWRRGIMDLAAEGISALFEPEFPAPSTIVVEIGFGRGEFLLDMAAKHPERAFLGVELSFKRVLKMARKVARARLENVRLIEARGEVVIAQCLAPSSVDEFWVNFSDPWPKATHARRRLVQRETIAAMAKALKPGGLLHVATDDVPYAEQIQQAFGEQSLLENLHAPEPFVREVPGRTATSYELEWRAEGRPIHFFDHRRRS